MAFDGVLQAAPLTLGSTAKFLKLAAGTDAVAIQLAFGETVSFQFNVDSAGTTDNVEIEILQGHRIKTGLGLDAASSTTSLDLNTASDPITVDDDLNSTFIVMTSGDERGEGAVITDSTDADDRVTIAPALSGTPSASETYDRYIAQPTKRTIVMTAAVSSTNLHALRHTTSWASGEWVLVRARATGATNAHRLNMSYQTDGGPA